MLAVLLALAPASVLAQEACPESGSSAADQALCWFDRSENSVGAEALAQLERAYTQCIDAALDEPRVAEACFLTPLRLGRLTEAREAFEYVVEPTPEQTSCADALSNVMPLRVLTVPEGGAVEVDGEPVGNAPVEVRLASPWWERSIAARFGETRVEAEPDRLLSAFDTRACAMSHLVIQGPEPEVPTQLERTPEPAPSAARVPIVPASDTSGVAVHEAWWFWTLVGVLVAGAVVGVSVGVALDSPMFELGTFE